VFNHQIFLKNHNLGINTFEITIAIANKHHYGIPLGHRGKTLKYRGRHCDSAMTTIQQCDDDNATVQWRQGDSTMTTER
jgi:hypothetical protein